MVLEITTVSRSIYVIDTEAQTWTRWASRWARPFRTFEGVYIWLSEIRVGVPLFMILPPITTTASYRTITSTPVMNVSEVS
jgi:hypothetical protein